MHCCTSLFHRKTTACDPDQPNIRPRKPPCMCVWNQTPTVCTPSSAQRSTVAVRYQTINDFSVMSSAEVKCCVIFVHLCTFLLEFRKVSRTRHSLKFHPCHNEFLRLHCLVPEETKQFSTFQGGGGVTRCLIAVSYVLCTPP